MKVDVIRCLGRIHGECPWLHESPPRVAVRRRARYGRAVYFMWLGAGFLSPCERPLNTIAAAPTPLWARASLPRAEVRDVHSARSEQNCSLWTGAGL
jgi:hypothetical protein